MTPHNTPLNRLKTYAESLDRRMIYALFFAVVLLLVGVTFGGDKHANLTLQGRTMGTTWLVKIAHDKPVDKGELNTAITDKLAYVNSIASTYDKNSEISKFNASTSTDWFAVSPFMIQNVTLAHNAWQLSGGRYDITIAPLIDLWGFDANGRVEKMPDVFQLATAKSKIGMEKIAYRLTPPALKKLDPNVTINLSSVAKGAGIDAVAMVLENQGITNYLVEIGGEIRAKGINDKSQPWTVGIEVPNTLRGTVQRAVQLNHNAPNASAIATSGDYRNYFEENGRRYSHIIDPTTGVPINHKLASVSVFATTTARADTWATMLLVLGDKQGLKIAETNKIPALFMVRDGDEFVEHTTTAYRALYGE